MESRDAYAANITLVERFAKRERAVLIATIVAVTLACWSWIVPMARDMYGAIDGSVGVDDDARVMPLKRACLATAARRWPSSSHTLSAVGS